MNRCDICSKTFANARVYTIHMASKLHKTRVEKAGSLPKCEKCGKSFNYPSGLSRHKKKCITINESESESESDTSIVNTQLKRKVKYQENETRSHKVRSSSTSEQVAQLSSLNERVKVLEIACGIMKKTGNPVLPSQSRSKITPSLRLEIKERQNHTCGMCKKQLSDIFQLDHTVALQFGGTNDPDNLMVLCCECHATKSIRENKHKHKIRSAILNILDVSIETNDPQ